MVEKLGKALVIAAAILMVATGSALAEKIYGDVIVGAGDAYTVKAANGKEYQVEKAIATGENLQNGDCVAMEMKEAKPVGVKKVQLADFIPAEITKTEGGVYTVKAKDGKEIQIKEELIKQYNPRTGDTVQIYMEGDQPVHVKMQQ